MIRWQNHIAGFVGAHKYLDRAFKLVQSISVSITVPAIPESGVEQTLGRFTFISTNGLILQAETQGIFKDIDTFGIFKP